MPISELNDALPADVLDPDDLLGIMDALTEKGVHIVEGEQDDRT